MWYRADHVAANAECPLIAGYPAGLLQARGVSAGAIARGTVSGGDRVVAWANEWGYLLEPGEDLRAARARGAADASPVCRPPGQHTTTPRPHSTPCATATGLIATPRPYPSSQSTVRYSSRPKPRSAAR